jgi:hypothetical protein
MTLDEFLEPEVKEGYRYELTTAPFDATQAGLEARTIGPCVLQRQRCATFFVSLSGGSKRGRMNPASAREFQIVGIWEIEKAALVHRIESGERV